MTKHNAYEERNDKSNGMESIKAEHTIYSLNLPKRINDILIREGLDTIDKIVACTKEDIINLNGLSNDDASLVIKKCEERGFDFTDISGCIDLDDLTGFESPDFYI